MFTRFHPDPFHCGEFLGRSILSHNHFQFTTIDQSEIDLVHGIVNVSTTDEFDVIYIRGTSGYSRSSRIKLYVPCHRFKHYDTPNAAINSGDVLRGRGKGVGFPPPGNHCITRLRLYPRMCTLKQYRACPLLNCLFRCNPLGPLNLWVGVTRRRLKANLRLYILNYSLSNFVHVSTFKTGKSVRLFLIS